MKIQLNDLMQNGTIQFFRGLSYRWEGTADPQRIDERDFMNEGEANAYVILLKNIGFDNIVEHITCSIEDAQALSDDQGIIDTADIWHRTCPSIQCEEIWNAGTYQGEGIAGAVLVAWKWLTYIGYARKFMHIGIAGSHINDPYMADIRTEADLIIDNETTNRTYYSLLLTAQEAEHYSKQGVLSEAIDEELYDDKWKWNNEIPFFAATDMVEQLVDIPAPEPAPEASAPAPALDAQKTIQELREAIVKLLYCPDLNFDELEEESAEAIEHAKQLLNKLP